ncbi:hypothetical protein [Chryseobacterium echinoideorum]|uniref:hypothetical protein n=1 Tax=Chryseobacterium echinoideorum TaxID=1549648 RepID=UPI0011859AFF|nr:hypothetical protein [Chryseobacterium echinoideorum]
MTNYSNTEKHILQLFLDSESITLNNIQYLVKKVGKPRPSRGECKTDIYVLLEDLSGTKKELKISVKQHNADFLENKISLSRAIEILGENAQEIITQSVKQIEKSFVNDYLINIDRFKRTEENCIKIGWKFELLNVLSGEKSGMIELSNDQKINVFSGSNLSAEKRNCKVNGEIIIESGVANFILESDSIVSNIEYYLDKMKNINEFSVQNNIYFACKALNYRMSKDKWDGDRPLAVYCNWFINDDGLLDVQIVFDHPLSIKGNLIGENIRNLLRLVGIDISNFTEIDKFVSPNVKVFRKP